MKLIRLAFVLASCALLAGGARAEDQKPDPSHGTPVRANAGFDLMKSLVGNWEMPGKDGGPGATVSFALISDGTALMETMDMAGSHASMVTMYHADGDKLMMTHYCGANNQPRMTCVKPTTDGKSLVFNYAGASNLATPATGHMHHLVVTLDDPGHMSETWTWKEGSKTRDEVFHFTRKTS